MKTHTETVTLLPTQTEVGTGEPGYRWANAVHIVRQDGSKLFPAVSMTEARSICKREGWLIAPQAQIEAKGAA